MGEDEGADAEGHTAAWGQEGVDPAPEPRKRPAPPQDEEDEMDDDVQQRLKTLRGEA